MNILRVANPNAGNQTELLREVEEDGDVTADRDLRYLFLVRRTVHKDRLQKELNSWTDGDSM
jgi:hypothetical protein